MSQAMTKLRAGRALFRNWRRRRPFWGGALLAAAGIEVLVAPAAQSLVLPVDLIIYAGIAGISGHLIGALLVGIGVLSWFQPAQNSFFGMVGIMLALVSFVTSNFGGFVIGMLLGIVGGGLVFAWGPEARERRSGGRHRGRGPGSSDAVDGDARPGGGAESVTDGFPGGDEDPGTRAEDTPPSGGGERSPERTRPTGTRRRT
ncbi:DUF6114 domain-containing protein [Nocardiopsis kunsanensis]|uniref:DUF6114 domain-containing protein n=1 Tax=Nocardiopsis kunsanensis TaxID=141693 RepID=UPI001EF9F7BC|nr:DUF6114 domain-containing protein [Nocardiopsis kunsanensis]